MSTSPRDHVNRDLGVPEDAAACLLVLPEGGALSVGHAEDITFPVLGRRGVPVLVAFRYLSGLAPGHKAVVHLTRVTAIFLIKPRTCQLSGAHRVRLDRVILELVGGNWRHRET